MFRIFFIFFTLFSLTHFCFSQVNNPKLLIIGLDGIRPDALRVANTPHLDLLMANGTYSYDALTRFPTKTVPGFASMLCGVWYEKHGIFSNSLTNNKLNRYPYILRYFENYDSSLVTALCTNSGLYSLQQHIINEIDTAIYETKDDVRKLLGVDYLVNNDPDIFFQYFGGCDFFGHTHSFSPNDANYINQIEVVDGYVGEILSALFSRPTYPYEDWLVLVSTDHGGIGSAHGGSTFEERNIFFIASGNSVQNMEVTRDTLQCEIDSALVFNGTDNFVKVLNNGSLNLHPARDFTIECRVKTPGTSNMSYILSNQDAQNDASKGFSIALNPYGFNRWIVNIGDGINNMATFGNVINDNAYHHLTIAFDRGKKMKVYQDGVFLNEVAISQIGDLTSLLDLAIGQDGLGSAPNYFQGHISEVRIWDALLDDGIIAAYAAKTVDAAHTYHDKLLGYWKLNENQGTTIQEHTGRHNNGTVFGSQVQWKAINESLMTFDYSNTPRLVDVAATALQHFCIPLNPSWELDGKSWVDHGCSYLTCNDVVTMQSQNLSYTSTKVQWMLVNGGTSYVLRYKKADDMTYTYKAITQHPKYEMTLMNLSPNTEYEWQVQTVCGPKGFPFSKFSTPDTFRTFGCVTPDPIYTSNVTDSSATLHWTGVPVSVEYNILGLDVNTLDLYDIQVPAYAQSKVLTNLNAGNTYIWRIRSECSGNLQSEFSDIDTFVAVTMDSTVTPIVKDPTVLQYDVDIHPNPFSGSTLLEVPEDEDASYTIVVKNMAGHVVHQVQGVNGNGYTFQSNGLPIGIYFVEFIGAQTYRGKMIIN